MTVEKMPVIFGVSGVARSGKTTFCKHLINKLERSGVPSVSISFAEEVKRHLDSFTMEKLNISCFTENTEEKSIIRPLLVCYATDVCRNKINENFWIKKVEKKIISCINNKVVVVIPDVRYKNEMDWIKSLGGFVVHIQRSGIKPANFEEKSNDPIVKKNADYNIKWKNFTDENKTCSFYLNKMFRKYDWSLYGKFK